MDWVKYIGSQQFKNSILSKIVYRTPIRIGLNTRWLFVRNGCELQNQVKTPPSGGGNQNEIVTLLTILEYYYEWGSLSLSQSSGSNKIASVALCGVVPESKVCMCVYFRFAFPTRRIPSVSFPHSLDGIHHFSASFPPEQALITSCYCTLMNTDTLSTGTAGWWLERLMAPALRMRLKKHSGTERSVAKTLNNDGDVGRQRTAVLTELLYCLRKSPKTSLTPSDRQQRGTQDRLLYSPLTQSGCSAVFPHSQLHKLHNPFRFRDYYLVVYFKASDWVNTGFDWATKVRVIHKGEVMRVRNMRPVRKWSTLG